MPLTVEVVAADRVLWEGEATAVAIPTVEGDMGILVGHQPVLGLLRRGVVRITTESNEKVEHHVDGGFLSVDQNQVTVVVDPSTEELDAVPTVLTGSEASDEGSESH